MKIIGQHGVIARIAGLGLALAVLLAMVLSCPIAGRAQASATSPTVPAAAPAKPAPAQAQAASGATKPAAGPHQGVKIHGHWTIEVRSPNGAVVSRTEFENALVQPGGTQDLAGLLLGGAVVGGYRVYLTSSPTAFTGPCALPNGLTQCILVGSLISPAPTTFSDASSGCAFNNGALNPITAAGPCFPLSISYVANTGVALSGTAVASSISPITDVFLTPILCYTGTPLLALAGETASPSSCAQGVAGATAWADLTHATLTTPVQITAVGQLIAVTVQLSFQ